VRASETFEKMKVLARQSRVLVWAHGYDELSADGIFFSEIMAGLPDALVVEDCPDASKGPSVLVL
jgi:hypothetical protein